MKLKPILEDYDELEDNFRVDKYTEKEKFQGKDIWVTSLYDGDLYGLYGGKNGYRFMISTPLDRGYGVDFDEDEIEVTDFDHSLSPQDVALLKAWTMQEME